MRIVEEIETPFNSVDVWETDRGYDFEVAGGTHATYDRSRLLTGYAWDAITAAVMLRAGPPPRHLLMLGVGGGTALRQLRHLLPQCDMTAIDIDPVMVDLARRYMDLDALKAKIVVGDAYQLIREETAQYDIIVDDVYLGVTSGVVRPANYTHDLISSLAARLTPRGVLVTNVITGQGHAKLQRAAKTAFVNTFPQVMAVTPPFGFNVSFVGGAALEKKDFVEQLSYHFDHPEDIREWERLTIRPVTKR